MRVRTSKGAFGVWGNWTRTAIVGVIAALALLAPATALALPPTPTAQTDPATGVTTSSAQLRGTGNSGGLPATYYFEYGTTTAYGSQTPREYLNPHFFVNVAINVPHPLDTRVVVSLGGLASMTTYHYQMVVTQNACLDTALENSCPIPPVTVSGGDQSFTTL